VDDAVFAGLDNSRPRSYVDDDDVFPAGQEHSARADGRDLADLFRRDAEQVSFDFCSAGSRDHNPLDVGHFDTVFDDHFSQCAGGGGNSVFGFRFDFFDEPAFSPRVSINAVSIYAVGIFQRDRFCRGAANINPD
jgi:hypothetical protein